MKFRKKPVVIEAFQWWPGKEFPMPEFSELNPLALMDGPEGQVTMYDDRKLVIKTLEGEIKASPGDWIIKGVNGEFYPCKPDIFAKTYEEAI